MITYYHVKYDVCTGAPYGVLPSRTKTGQGWGITTDGESLIVSDGSQYLFFWDPITMKETRRVEVRMRKRGEIFTIPSRFSCINPWGSWDSVHISPFGTERFRGLIFYQVYLHWWSALMRPTIVPIARCNGPWFCSEIFHSTCFNFFFQLVLYILTRFNFFRIIFVIVFRFPLSSSSRATVEVSRGVFTGPRCTLLPRHCNVVDRFRPLLRS